MIRNDEIKRLLHYGKSLGVKITIKNSSFDDSGYFSDTPKMVILVNKKHQKNKTHIILTLLHELAHAKFFVLNNRPVSDAWVLEADRAKDGPKLPKKLRKEIVDFELDSLDLMMNIAKELNIKLPTWKIKRQIEFDKFHFKVYFKNGVFPSGKTLDVEWDRLTKIYKKESK